MAKQAIIGGKSYDFPDDVTDAEIDAMAVSILGGAKATPTPAAPSVKTVKFEGKDYEFPVDATDAEIMETLDSISPAKKPQPSAREQALNRPGEYNREMVRNVLPDAMNTGKE